MYYLTFVLVMLTPLALLLVGLRWKLRPPKREGSGLAYRTALSSRTEETWNFAHRHLAKLWVRIGLILSVVSILLMVFLKAHYTSFALWLIGGQMVLLCVSAFLVDSLLKAAFDEEGRRIA